MKSSRRQLRQGARHGFTLIEVLAATTLFAILVAALVTTFFGVMRLREGAEARLSESRPGAYAVSVLKRDLLGMVPPVGVLAGAMIGERVEEAGACHDHLQFYATAVAPNDLDPWGDVLALEYGLRETEGTGAGAAKTYDLVRDVTRNLLSPTVETPEEHVLLTGVVSFRVSYYDGTEWCDSWDSTLQENALPQAIQIRVDLAAHADGTAQTPVELTVPVTVRARSTTATPAGGSG